MSGKKVFLNGSDLNINNVVMVSRFNHVVDFSSDEEIWRNVRSSCQYIQDSVNAGDCIYGVTTGFGGMANINISKSNMLGLQSNLLHFLNAGAGDLLSKEDVRATMVVRCNSHLKGASGIRAIVIERIRLFLNKNITPHVRSLGSIGASGDLVPLCNIAGAVVGLDKKFKVDIEGETVDCLSALKKLDLKPIQLLHKEGLAMLNGTSAMTGIAANCVYDTKQLLALSMLSNAFFVQALHALREPFQPFTHKMKPHKGQSLIASMMLDLLSDSKMICNELPECSDGRPPQDQYSIRCLPQYLGPIFDGVSMVEGQINIEINSATDNPLIDSDNQASYQGGNFFGQYVGIGMDQLRSYLSLLIKHLDIQISLLVSPKFSHGLTPSLVGNVSKSINMGLKGLQISANSITPLVAHMGNSIVDRFPPYAEQFNQNINSQGFNSACLTRKTIELCQQYFAISLIFSLQSVDIRTHCMVGHYDARATLSPFTCGVYEELYAIIGKPMGSKKPLIWNDDEQSIEELISIFHKEIKFGSRINKILSQLTRQF